MEEKLMLLYIYNIYLFWFFYLIICCWYILIFIMKIDICILRKWVIVGGWVVIIWDFCFIIKWNVIWYMWGYWCKDYVCYVIKIV